MAGMTLWTTHKFATSCRSFTCTSKAVKLIHNLTMAISSNAAPEKTLKMPGLSKQYLLIKNKFPDFIVLFQVGDFYEIYSDDALKVSEKTSLRLSRNPNVNKFMAGFPVKSLDSWLSTLVQQGFQLAICPQFPDKTPAKSRLMHREVVRLVTPGTLLEPPKADANYLLCIAQGPDMSLGLAWLDLSTGGFHLGLSSLGDLEEDLSRVNPAEILIAEEHLQDAQVQHNHKTGTNMKRSPLESLKDYHLTLVPSEWFSSDNMSQQPGSDLSGYVSDSGEFSSLELIAGAALLRFVSYTQRDIAPLVSRPSRFSHQTHMAIDANTRRALELTKPLMGTDKKATLFGVMNNTVTASGKRLLFSRLCAPSTELDVVQRRLRAVEFFWTNRHLTEEVLKNLKLCPDVERKLQRVATGCANLSDLRSIHGSISLYNTLLSLIRDAYVTGSFTAIDNLLMEDFDSVNILYNELDSAVGHLISDTSVMDGYSDTADEIKEKLEENGKEVEELKRLYRENFKIARLVINSHKSFIRVVEIPAAKESQLAENQDFVLLEKTSDKVRYSTLKLQELNAKLKALQEEHEQIQRALSVDLCNQVTSHAESLKRMAASMAELDVSCSLAMLALQRGYVKPNIAPGKEFTVRGGRHPVVDMLQPNSFVCNDCDLGGEKTVWIVTGPNMGGKSTFLRQNALLAILAQAGSFVPAQSATLGMVDRVFARIGASDNLVQYQSTFMSEMLETAHILTQATEKSLVVIDEVGRGTSMLDGLSLAWAVIEHLHSHIQCRTLASTHYYQLARLADVLPRVDCYHVTAKHSKDGISFTFKVIRGCDRKSFGIDVAKLAGVPLPVEIRAREILKNLEKNDNILKNTLADNKLLREKQSKQCKEKAKDSSEHLPEAMTLSAKEAQVEIILTKALLLLKPEAITPLQALEVIYDLHAKARDVKRGKRFTEKFAETP